MAFLVLPASGNYQMEGLTVGNAGGGNIGSSNYTIEGSLGEPDSQTGAGSSFDLKGGLTFVRQSNVPTIASFSNVDNDYNKLHLVIDEQNNPDDVLYAIAVSSDNFLTTYYVKDDHTLGDSFDINNYQTYDLWGGSEGFDILGLESNTIYKVKIKAVQGKYTETDYGPTATAATVSPQLVFDIDVSVSDTTSEPPYVVTLGDLYPGSVTTSSDKVWVSVETNGSSGAGVYVYGQNGGLQSTATGYTIAAVNGDLGSVDDGFGVQGLSVDQSAGGPLVIENNYSGNGNVVGITDTLVRQIFYSMSPLSGGRGSFVIKAKSGNDTPAAGDYSEILTIVAAANF